MYATTNDKKIMSEIKKIADLKSKNLNSRFCIVDKKEIILFLTNNTPDESYEHAIHVKSPMFATALITMVEAVK